LRAQAVDRLLAAMRGKVVHTSPLFRGRYSRPTTSMPWPDALPRRQIGPCALTEVLEFDSAESRKEKVARAAAASDAGVYMRAP
jgi:hypothetical protein